ncbi:hypothetical protein PIB30_020179 [Stylosanthes scabra]|uniref:Secreted protein n=1 Tax=Stylosanthes scabra TaxID=79078 RepID=A0ABU6Q8G4_9FABA|nr:hypothetical protein [Stylosanthes scabra]
MNTISIEAILCSILSIGFAATVELPALFSWKQSTYSSSHSKYLQFAPFVCIKFSNPINICTQAHAQQSIGIISYLKMLTSKEKPVGIRRGLRQKQDGIVSKGAVSGTCTVVNSVAQVDQPITLRHMALVD